MRISVDCLLQKCMQARSACILPAPVQEHNFAAIPALCVMHKGSLDLACSTCSVHECVPSLNGDFFCSGRFWIGLQVQQRCVEGHAPHPRHAPRSLGAPEERQPRKGLAVCPGGHPLQPACLLSLFFPLAGGGGHNRRSREWDVCKGEDLSVPGHVNAAAKTWSLYT